MTRKIFFATTSATIGLMRQKKRRQDPFLPIAKLM
jgi:hypothetical protein